MSDLVRLQKLAHDMITFKEETIKLCKRKGQLFAAGDLVLSDANEDSVVETSSLSGIKGMSFFTVAPVYVAAQVPYSFLEQYAGEVDKDTNFLTFETPRPFAEGLDVQEDGKILGTWNNKVHGVGTEFLLKFSDFMTSQVLARERDLYGISHQDLYVQDPVIAAKKGLTADKLKIRVFVPHTRRGYFSPYVDLRTGLMKFILKPPMKEMSDKLAIVMKARAAHVVKV